MTIQQAISTTLKELGLKEAAKCCWDETLQVHIFETVCKYMDSHEMEPDNLDDTDFVAAEEDHTGYTIGAQVADIYLTKFAKILDIEPSDFGAEDFYKVSEKRWDKPFWPEEE